VDVDYDELAAALLRQQFPNIVWRCAECGGVLVMGQGSDPMGRHCQGCEGRGWSPQDWVRTHSWAEIGRTANEPGTYPAREALSSFIVASY